MNLTTNDIGVLVYIAQRERPLGGRKWDEAGIAAHLRRLDGRGFGFGEILDRVIAHARDRSALTPAVLMTSISTRAAEPATRRNPTRNEQCPDCGLRRTACVCDPMVRRKPPVNSQAPDVKAALEDARAQIRAQREAG